MRAATPGLCSAAACCREGSSCAAEVLVCLRPLFCIGELYTASLGLFGVQPSMALSGLFGCAAELVLCESQVDSI